jgi:hypothetical protein
VEKMTKQKLKDLLIEGKTVKNVDLKTSQVLAALKELIFKTKTNINYRYYTQLKKDNKNMNLNNKVLFISFWVNDKDQIIFEW